MPLSDCIRKLDKGKRAEISGTVTIEKKKEGKGEEEKMEEREKRKRRRVKRMGGKRMGGKRMGGTRCPKAIYGHRYPCPAFGQRPRRGR